MKSLPIDQTAMEERMDKIRLKQILGTPITHQELMCLQMEENGFGCGARKIGGLSCMP